MRSSSRPHQVRLALLMTLILAVLSWPTRTSAQGPTQEQLELGTRVYAENCAVCHGATGEGRVGVTLSKDWPSIRPDLRVKSVVEAGIPGSPMPAWSQKNGGPLSDAEIEALVLYILSWETGGVPPLSPTPTIAPRPPITPVPDVQGDPNRGAVLYAQNCAPCHGANGEGRVGATLAKVWPAIRADLRIKATIERGVPGSPMLAWSQANGGPLAEADINDIVAFIMSWEIPPQAPEVAPTPTPAPSALSGPLGVAVTAAVLLALVLFIAIRALARQK